MKKVLSVMVAGMLLVLFVGCGLVTVKKDVDFNREGLKIGMTKIEFYKVYPESVFKETRMTLDGTKIEALEVADEY